MLLIESHSPCLVLSVLRKFILNEFPSKDTGFRARVVWLLVLEFVWFWAWVGFFVFFLLGFFFVVVDLLPLV